MPSHAQVALASTLVVFGGGALIALTSPLVALVVACVALVIVAVLGA